MPERQCSLQFKDLSPAQESLLDEFIMKYTAGTS
jgi:c-di-GMP-binding flagellar brake protein YcgR